MKQIVLVEYNKTLYIKVDDCGIPLLLLTIDGITLVRFGKETTLYIKIQDVLNWFKKELEWNIKNRPEFTEEINKSYKVQIDILEKYLPIIQACPPMTEVTQAIKSEMTKEGHIERHKELHKAFDELLADFMSKTAKLPSKTPILELMEWSHQQTINPTEVNIDLINIVPEGGHP